MTPRPLLALLLVLATAAPAAAADLEGPLNAHFKGGWVIVRVAIASDCGGLYTNNEVHGRGTDSGGSERFAAGVAKVRDVYFGDCPHESCAPLNGARK